MKNTIFIINWEIKRSGKIREFSTLDEQEFKEVLKNIEKSDRYELIEFYKMELVK